MLLPMLAGTGLRTSWVAGRYALLPHVMLFAGIAGSLPRTRGMTWGLSIVLAALAITAAVQVQLWRNSESLFGHALAVTRDNHLVHYNLGVALQAQRRFADAAEQYRAAAHIEPNYLEAHVNLGAMLQLLGDTAGAEAEYRAALRIDPTDAEARENLAMLLAGRSGSSTMPATAPAQTAPSASVP